MLRHFLGARIASGAKRGMVRGTDKTKFRRRLLRAGKWPMSEEPDDNLEAGDVGGTGRTEARRRSDAPKTPHRWLRGVAKWVIGFHGSPPQVGLGMAVGVFVAFSPTLGFQMIVAALLATLLRANRTAAVASVWLSNPFTALPMYMTTYVVGRFLLPGYEPIKVKVRLRAVLFDDEGEWLNLAMQFRELYSLGGEVLVPLLVGGFIVGLPVAIVAYIVTRLAIDFAHRHIPRRHGLGREKRSQGEFSREGAGTGQKAWNVVEQSRGEGSKDATA